MLHCMIDRRVWVNKNCGLVIIWGSSMDTIATRACVGFSAGSIAVLTFHQGLSEVFLRVGLPTHGGFRISPTWPFGLPSIVSLCFWGGIYGIAFAVSVRGRPTSLWRQGLLMGLLAAAIGLFIVTPLKGHGIAYHGALWPIGRAMILNLSWGLGMGLLLPLLWPRPLTTPPAEPSLRPAEA